MAPVRQIITVLGDQLSPAISSLQSGDPQRDVVLMAEVEAEATYVRHHKKKIAFVFSAMRHFAVELRQAGWRVVYRTLDETGPRGSIAAEVRRLRETLDPERIVMTEPGEWRLRREMEQLAGDLDIPLEVLTDNRFVCSTAQFADWAMGRKQLRMEHFYREMRRKTGLLMNGDEPEGGRWNFDKQNRKPARGDLFMPGPLRVEPDRTTREVLDLVGSCFADHFGELEPFWFAVTRDDANRALDHFIDAALASFGDYQDAMLVGEQFLYHSVLALYINSGLLDARDVCRKVAEAYANGAAPLNAAEGFIRQIIGWREYVRGIYWLRMPGYREENLFGHTQPVPDFYWTAETGMACLRAAITQTRDEAYAHHIQRLMVTGNFALLAGVSPQALHEWYLEVYADAYEWVELPNTLGMSQFADGGLLASKPYVASGAYIDRMSDHCKGCRYDVRSRTSEDACPFNALYWDFVSRHRERLSRNPRMGPMYRTLDRFPPSEADGIRARAAKLLDAIEEL